MNGMVMVGTMGDGLALANAMWLSELCIVSWWLSKVGSPSAQQEIRASLDVAEILTGVDSLKCEQGEHAAQAKAACPAA